MDNFLNTKGFESYLFFKNRKISIFVEKWNIPVWAVRTFQNWYSSSPAHSGSNSNSMSMSLVLPVGLSAKSLPLYLVM